MKFFVLFLGLSSLFPTVTQDILKDIPPEHRAILPEGKWTPTEEQTVLALHAIDSFIQQITPKNSVNESSRIKERLKGYHVQFVGEQRGETKVVWCNFITMLSSDWDWKRQALFVCDGGSAFWQIDYDPKTGQLSRFIVNGFA